MQYLMDVLDQVVPRILGAPRAFFLLDYDGTLTPIMPKPPMARLHDSTRKVLERLTRTPRFSVAIVTGRKLGEIKPMVKLDGLVYSGNHGLELQGPDFNYTHAKSRQFTRILKQVKDALRPLPAAFPGTFVEDKGVTLTYHYRLLAPPTLDEAMKAEFIRRVSPWLDDKKVRVIDAKKAYEIVPNLNWSKASAVRWILLHEDPESLPVYIGDDKADENPFRVLDERGVTIRVGYEGKSYAHYFVESPEEVEKFLTGLADRAAQEQRSKPKSKEVYHGAVAG